MPPGPMFLGLMPLKRLMSVFCAVTVNERDAIKADKKIFLNIAIAFRADNLTK
jgi:hypothetical protein